MPASKAVPWWIVLSTLLASPGVDADNGPLPSREQEDEKLSVHFGVYDQSDGADNRGGNPFIDEQETVYEAIVILDRKISDTDHQQLRFLGDLVSSASVTRNTNPMFQTLQSNPSGTEHGELGIGWRRTLPDYTVAAETSISAESSEYYSLGWGSSISLPLAGGNTDLKLSYRGSHDDFENKLFNGLEPDRQQRDTHTLEGNITRILTPTTVASVTLDYTRQNGFLGTTWYSVFADGEEVSERVPGSRNRHSLTTRLRQSLGESSALELSYRWYDDDWQIRSDTYELRYFQYVLDRRIILEPNLRYTDQRSAFFYDIEFDRPLQFMSSDPDLGEFDGRSAGLKGTLLNASWFNGRKADISLSLDYYRRSDGLDIVWTIFGYTRKF